MKKLSNERSEQLELKAGLCKTNSLRQNQDLEGGYPSGEVVGQDQSPFGHEITPITSEHLQRLHDLKSLDQGDTEKEIACASSHQMGLVASEGNPVEYEHQPPLQKTGNIQDYLLSSDIIDPRKS
jgi:hypothetical protein